MGGNPDLSVPAVFANKRKPNRPDSLQSCFTDFAARARGGLAPVWFAGPSVFSSADSVSRRRRAGRRGCRR
ncbi:hypothetical protein T556_09440 [Neisseria gonorrhoeae NG-k51.05]|nr:hypothetical protein T556_09440 [Neisseria gonorrhoeae NG-k51.05]